MSSEAHSSDMMSFLSRHQLQRCHSTWPLSLAAQSLASPLSSLSLGFCKELTSFLKNGKTYILQGWQQGDTSGGDGATLHGSLIPTAGHMNTRPR